MRRWMAAPVLLAGLFGLSVEPPTADAQAPATPEAESFLTADGVRLKGLFHKSPNGNKTGDAVVILLYPPGTAPDRMAPLDMLKGDWDGLIGKLNADGYHVFRFDWRGHGQSTDIVDPLGDNQAVLGVLYNGFWVNNITGGRNQKFVKGWGKKPVKNDLRAKTDITNAGGYFPVYVNDLAAVRLHLDQKNDNGSVNTSSIYLVGVGDTAALGLMWLTAEWQRHAIAPMLPMGLQYMSVPPRFTLVPPNPAAGADVAGMVWLSATRPQAVPETNLQGWVRSALKIRDNNKMLFVYGGTDDKAKAASEVYYHKVLVADGNKQISLSKVEQTFLYPVPNVKLNGLALLGKDDVLKTETKVVEYLNALQKVRVAMLRKNRNFTSPYYVDQDFFMR